MKTKTILSYVVCDSAIQSKEPADCLEKVLPYLNSIRHADRENFVALFLNVRNRIIAVETVSIGTLSTSLVHPREVFKGAILFNAAAIIVAHNHPSGDCMPSPEDRLTTKRISEAGKILGIQLLDHIIVGPDSHFSFREGGLLI